MKTVVNSLSLFVAEGTYHSCSESRFSAERWRRGHGVSAGVVVMVAFVAIGSALVVLM